MLFIVPTPIGNLGDITYRAVEVLKAVDAVICEDTRRTQKLLNHYGIRKELVSFHDHSGPAKAGRILERLCAAQKLALVTDSGTPLISDPGFPVVRDAIRAGVRVEALPGPTAMVTALTASGLAANRISFLGFLPVKEAAKKKTLQEIADRPDTMIFYESPYRLVKTLKLMREVFGVREAVIARELTKVHEEIARGSLETLLDAFSRRKVLGEIVILVAGQGAKGVLE